MRRPAHGTLLRVLAPLLGGAGIGAILQAADPRARLYLAASPGLVAGMASAKNVPRVPGERAV